MACSTCGFDDRSVSAADAAVAIRSYDRRFRDVVVRRDDEERADSLVRRQGAAGWSALDHVSFTAAALADTGEALRRILISDEPSVTVPSVDGAPSGRDADVDEVLADLSGAAASLAKTIEGASGEDWNRPGSTASGSVTALDVARNGVHIGVHHLRAAEHVIQEVRGQPA